MVTVTETRNCKKATLAFFLCIFFVAGLGAQAQTSVPATDTTHTVINQNDVSALPQQTGISQGELQQIQNSLGGNSIKPEITVPASGGSVSGKNLQIKGIASPNASIDLLIESGTTGISPLAGKTTSDKYGVWSYFLGPELPPGNYTIKVFSQIGIEKPLSSDPLPFSVHVVADAAATAAAGPSVVQTFENQPFVIIILAIIFCITFVITVLVWAAAWYFRSAQRAQSSGRMRTWENPDIASMSEEEWRRFVYKMEQTRNFLYASHPANSVNDSFMSAEQELELPEVAEVAPVAEPKPIKPVVKPEPKAKISFADKLKAFRATVAAKAAAAPKEPKAIKPEVKPMAATAKKKPAAIAKEPVETMVEVNPLVAPELEPLPVARRVVKPAPVEISQAVPEPIPEPIPEPVPEPVPEPTTEPVPEPIPEPTPEPEPLPAPKVIIKSALKPEPLPEPAPEPLPAPKVNIKPRAIPIPEPAVLAAVEPEPQPLPEPVPVIAPKPEPLPAPQISKPAVPPIPEAIAAPAPVVMPEPAPAVKPEPEPLPAPAVIIKPAAAPIPEPVAEPAFVPTPAPIPQAPVIPAAAPTIAPEAPLPSLARATVAETLPPPAPALNIKSSLRAAAEPEHAPMPEAKPLSPLEAYLKAVGDAKTAVPKTVEAPAAPISAADLIIPTAPAPEPAAEPKPFLPAFPAFNRRRKEPDEPSTPFPGAHISSPPP